MPKNTSDLFFAYGWSTGSLTASMTSQMLVNESSERKSLSLMSNCPDPIFLRFRDGAVTSALFTIRIPSYQLYEVPAPVLSASVHIVFGSASGSVKWLEVT